MRAAVIGGGSWGRRSRSVSQQRARLIVWAHDQDVAVALSEKHENPKYLPGLALPEKSPARTISPLFERGGDRGRGEPSHVRAR